MADTAQIWDLWAPEVAAHGLSCAHGRLDATDVLFGHAAGPALPVEVRGGRVWPTAADYGRPVIMDSSDVGLLRSWWASPDEQEWRWSVELYTHR